ncbi:MAG: GNAT family N-acetyltransferase [Parvibaculum sp.]|uniref:GNAT family N-acetyltransferase n=1 Tax=Parvibaculum sp. TaxID=2024848 RepID=UPI0025CCD310|nr:GNAT family N-acetyltransferase [Parvibaculum sp.]MCE9649905.1 GNAT family N-acetyltransferase [Parvibaculum sp.]
MSVKVPALAAEPHNEPTPPPKLKGEFAYELLRASQALEWSGHGGKTLWAALCDECSWCTAFQTPGYFDVWSKHYAKSWSPLLVIAWRKDGTLAGVMPLAARDTLITGAGAHQAEYHGWICRAEDAQAFAAGAFAMLAEAMPGHAVKLRYLPPGMPRASLTALQSVNPCIDLYFNSSHELAIDRKKIEESQKKKANKSKFNRLARLGKISVRRLNLPDLEQNMDRLVGLYDFRQGALHGVCPFLDDPIKRPFHLDWLRREPKQIFASGMFLDEQLISAFLFVVSKNEAHLAISAHAPEYAEHSPSKLHLYEAALSLAEVGVTVVDLTPGDDAWKERFSTASRSNVELVVHTSIQRAGVVRAREAATRAVKRVLAGVGITPKQIKSTWRAWQTRAVGTIESITRRPVHEARLHLALTPSAAFKPVIDVSIDDLQALTRYGPALARMRRQPFLQQALQRIEAGERCYTAPAAGALAAMGWLSRKPEPALIGASSVPVTSAVLYNFDVDDDGAPNALRPLAAHMLYDLQTQTGFSDVYALIKQNAEGAHAALALLGFKPAL